jgi:hypothetical protein
MGGVSPGPGAQGTKDGPLGVGPMPVLSEPLGSSISDHGSAGLPRCRDLVVHREYALPANCPQICGWAHDLASRTQSSDMTPPQESATEKSSVRSRSGRRKARRRRRNRPPEVEARARLKVRQPDDLLALLPYLVGFHPDEDLVAVFIKSGRVKLTTRTDIPPESAGDELAEWIDALAKRERADALALIAYSAASLPANRLLTHLMGRLSEHELTDVLYVGHGRWWSLTCGEACCPLAGTPYDLSSHPMSAAAVLAGLGVRTNRRELEASISGPPEAELPRLVDAAEDLLAELEPFDSRKSAGELLVSIMDSAMADPSALDERNCLLLGLLVTDVYVRDSAWARIGRSDAEDHVRLWGSVVTRVPPVLAPAPLCLLGMAAWVSGQGALVNCCRERVSQVDPDYSMGKLLSDIGERGIPPSIWQEIKDDMQAELDADQPLLAG